MYFYSPDVAIVEMTPLCGGQCLRCGLPIRSSTLPSPRYSAPAFTDRSLPTGSRSCDVTSDFRRDPKESKMYITFGDDDVDGQCRAAAAAAAKKRVRFAPSTSDVTNDVSRQLEPDTPPPPSQLPSSSFVKMQTARSNSHSQSAPPTAASLTTFIGPLRDASVV